MAGFFNWLKGMLLDAAVAVQQSGQSRGVALVADLLDRPLTFRAGRVRSARYGHVLLLGGGYAFCLELLSYN
jgi:hypothetical protein